MASASDAVLEGMRNGTSFLNTMSQADTAAKELAVRRQLGLMQQERENAMLNFEKQKYQQELNYKYNPQIYAASLAKQIAPEGQADIYYAAILKQLQGNQAQQQYIQQQQNQKLAQAGQQDLGNVDVTLKAGDATYKTDAATLKKLQANPLTADQTNELIQKAHSSDQQTNSPIIPPLVPTKTQPTELNPDGVNLVPSTDQLSDQSASQQLPPSQLTRSGFGDTTNNVPDLNDLVATNAAQRQIERGLNQQNIQSQISQRQIQGQTEQQKAQTEQGKLALDKAKTLGEFGGSSTAQTGDPLLDLIAQRGSGTTPPETFLRMTKPQQDIAEKLNERFNKNPAVEEYNKTIGDYNYLQNSKNKVDKNGFVDNATATTAIDSVLKLITGSSRPGEAQYEQFLKSGNVSDSVKNLVKQYNPFNPNRNFKMTPAQFNDIYNAATDAFNGKKQARNQAASEINKLSMSYGIHPKFTSGDNGELVKSSNDYQNIKSGSQYIDPNGNLRIKK